jgi:hypothetical protein
MSEKGGPAFPCQIDNHGSGEMEGFNGEVIKPKNFSAYPGMSLRDYFAAKAQAGMLANYNVINTPEHVAQMAYAHADAMLAERAK